MINVLTVGGKLPEHMFKVKVNQVDPSRIVKDLADQGIFKSINSLTWSYLYSKPDISILLINAAFYKQTLQQACYAITHGMSVYIRDIDGDVHIFQPILKIPRNDTTVPPLWYKNIKQSMGAISKSFTTKLTMLDDPTSAYYKAIKDRFDQHTTLFNKLKQWRCIQALQEFGPPIYERFVQLQNLCRVPYLAKLEFNEQVETNAPYERMLHDILQDEASLIQHSRQFRDQYCHLKAADPDMYTQDPPPVFHKDLDLLLFAQAWGRVYNIDLYIEQPEEDNFRVFNNYGGSMHAYYSKAQQERVLNNTRPAYDRMYQRTIVRRLPDMARVAQILFYLQTGIEPDLEPEMDELPRAKSYEYEA